MPVMLAGMEFNPLFTFKLKCNDYFFKFDAFLKTGGSYCETEREWIQNLIMERKVPGATCPVTYFQE